MPEASEQGSSTVLVVDDDPAVRRVASKALRRAGYEVVEARGGREAIESVRALEGGVDLLLTDVVMPGMNGRELSERLRSERPELPVLFMSAYAEDEIFLHGVRVARMNFLPKPFSLDELVDAVDELMSHPAAGDEAE